MKKALTLVEFLGAKQVFGYFGELSAAIIEALNEINVDGRVYYPIDQLYREGTHCIGKVTIEACDEEEFESRKGRVVRILENKTQQYKFPVSSFTFVRSDSTSSKEIHSKNIFQ